MSELPEWLTHRRGRGPVVVVAPHGGRRQRPVRRGDNVNDLYTVEIAAELAERLDAHAIINSGLDRNDIDLNRIGALAEKAPYVLGVLRGCVEEAGSGGEVPLVLLVHGWNMVLPCCDIGIGLRRNGQRLTGRYPTVGRATFDGFVAALEHELAARGLSSDIGRRYPANGADNATQLFSGRHVGHSNGDVDAVSRLAAGGGVDAVQLELGIPLRWPGARRSSFIEALTEAVRGHVASSRPDGRADDGRFNARSEWGLPYSTRSEVGAPVEDGYTLQAVVADGVGIFTGVEATAPGTMAGRVSVVSDDGSMMLLVGEGPWDGVAGRYALEGLDWAATEAGEVHLRVRGQMIAYRTHEAYLDLEAGLAESELAEADIELSFREEGDGFGRLRGRLRAGAIDVDVDCGAFLDRGSRSAMNARSRVRLAVADGEMAGLRLVSDGGSEQRLTLLDAEAEGAARIHVEMPGSRVLGGEIVARVPVWRDLPGGARVLWSFGLARCLVEESAGRRRVNGLFDSVQVFD